MLAGHHLNVLVRADSWQRMFSVFKISIQCLCDCLFLSANEVVDTCLSFARVN